MVATHVRILEVSALHEAAFALWATARQACPGSAVAWSEPAGKMPALPGRQAVSARGDVPDNGVHADFHGGLAADETHQHHHAFPAGHHLADDRAQAVEDPARDPDFLARRNFVRDLVHAVGPDQGVDLLDGLVRHRWP